MYAFIKNSEIVGIGACKLLNKDIINIQITDKIAENIQNYKFVSPDKIVPKTESEIEEEKTEDLKQQRIAEIKVELDEIDKQSQRSSRAISLCILNEKTPNPDDVEKLMEYENAAAALREELQELENPKTQQLQG